MLWEGSESRTQALLICIHGAFFASFRTLKECGCRGDQVVFSMVAVAGLQLETFQFNKKRLIRVTRPRLLSNIGQRYL